MSAAVQRHYGRRDPLASILRSLRDAGVDPERPDVHDLGRFDELHLRGREATRELAARIDWRPGLRVADAGAGLGGSSRYLAAVHEARVTAVDLTPSYCAAARELSRRAGVAHRTAYLLGDVTSLPLPDATFDVAWTQHAQMNVADKEGFYRELGRVLRPGGRLLFHDIFSAGGHLRFPVPWAPGPALSHLARPERVRSLLAESGLEVVDWADRTAASLAWTHGLVDRLRQGPGGAGHADRIAKFEHVARGLDEGVLVVVQAVAVRST